MEQWNGIVERWNSGMVDDKPGVRMRHYLTKMCLHAAVIISGVYVEHGKITSLESRYS